MTMVPDGLYKWISTQNHNLPLIALLTFGMPKMLVEASMKATAAKEPGGDKKACVTLSFDCDFPKMPKHAFRDPHARALQGQGELRRRGALGREVSNEYAMVKEYGHELMNHTYSHPDNEILNPGRKFATSARRRSSGDRAVPRGLPAHVRREMTGLRIPHFAPVLRRHLPAAEADRLRVLVVDISPITTSRGLPFMGPENIVEFPLATCPLHPSRSSIPAFAQRHASESPDHASRTGGVPGTLRRADRDREAHRVVHQYLHGSSRREEDSRFERMLELLSDPELIVTTYEDYLAGGLPIVGARGA